MKRYRLAIPAIVGLLVFVVAFSLAGCGDSSGTAGGKTRNVTDMRGVTVSVPVEISKVVDLSDGFITSVMYSFGLADKVVALGSDNLKDVDKYDFTLSSGETIKYENGMNPVTLLYPEVKKLPAVAKYEEAINVEKIASLEPDVIIVRKGFGSMNVMEYGTEEDIKKNIELLESLGIPVVVLYGPPAFKKPTVQKISEEIEVLGDVFGKKAESKELNQYLEGVVAAIEERTKGVAEDNKPSVLLLGLSPNARESGSAGDVLCTDTIESNFVTEVVNARNAYDKAGAWKMMNTEQILVTDPDVILLPTDWGYHPAEELYGAPYYENLRLMKAVQNKRVYALPWTPYNCAKRLEYPLEIMVMAKAAYPELFQDFKVNEQVLDFYRNVYHVDVEKAGELRSVQWLDWTVKEGF